MLDGRFKANIEKGLRPIGLNLRKTGITADHLTHARRGHGGRRGGGHRHGQLRVGLLLLVLTGLPDTLDGAVAKASGTAGPAGRLLRLGVRPRLRLAAARRRGLVPGQHPPGPPVAAARWPCWPRRCSSPTSGPRPSRSASTPGAGIMERAERIILLGLGLLFDSLLVPILWVMLALTLVTAVQRFVKVWRQASVERPQVTHAPAGPVAGPPGPRRRRGSAPCAAVAPPDPPATTVGRQPGLRHLQDGLGPLPRAAPTRGRGLGPLRQPGRGPRLGRAAPADRAPPPAGARPRASPERRLRPGRVPRRSSPTAATGSTRSGCRA